MTTTKKEGLKHAEMQFQDEVKLVCDVHTGVGDEVWT